MNELDPNWNPEPISHPFADDSPASVYLELKDGEALIRKAVEQIVEMDEAEVRAHDQYEAAKNDTLRQLFDEEEGKDIKKRTETQRTAIYRLKHRQLRRGWQLAKSDAAAQKKYVDVLLGIQTSIEARAKLIAIDERFAGGKYGT